MNNRKKITLALGLLFCMVLMFSSFNVQVNLGTEVINADEVEIDNIGQYGVSEASFTDSQDLQTNDLGNQQDYINTYAYVEASPISITSESELSAAGFPGFGTEADPYRIEGKNITGTGFNDLITISNTRSHILIEDNLLNQSEKGVYLQNTTNIVVAKNKIGDFSFGIELYNTTGITVDSNYIDKNQSTVHIYIRDSQDFVGKNNHLVNASNGMYLSGVKGCLISNNTLINSQHGIKSDNMGSCIIEDNTVVDTVLAGIRMYSSNNNIVQNNKIINSVLDGLLLIGSTNNIIRDNVLTNTGIFIEGTLKEHYDNTEFDNNTVNGKEFVFWTDTDSGPIPKDVGQLLLFNVSGVELSGYEIYNTSIPIVVVFSTDVIIRDSSFGNTYISILLARTNSSVVERISSYNEEVGTINIVENSNSNTIRYNSFTGDGISAVSIDTGGSSNTTITRNTFVNQSTSIYLHNADGNIITHNEFINSSDNAIYTASASYNYIAYNNFIDNNEGEYSQVTEFNADNTYEYNYWNNWTEPDGDGDGIVDNSYPILDSGYGEITNGTDPYPKTTPYDLTAPSISGPIDLVYVEGFTGNSLIWTVSDTNPDVYNITRNGSVFKTSTAWTNGTIEINVDGLSLGKHQFIIHVYDTNGNEIIDVVFVKVTSAEDDDPETTTTPIIRTSSEPDGVAFLYFDNLGMIFSFAALGVLIVIIRNNKYNMK